MFNYLINKGANNYEEVIYGIVNGENPDKEDVIEILLAKAQIEHLQNIFDNLDEDLWQILLPLFVEYGINIDKQVELAIEDNNDYLANLLIEGLDRYYKKFKIISTIAFNQLKNITNLSKDSKDILSNFI